jgi:hypothetical protein
MLLRCPHCNRSGEHVRSDFFGDWVVCSVCELPFAWREARAEESGRSPNGHGPDGHSPNGNGQKVKQSEVKTHDER